MIIRRHILETVRARLGDTPAVVLLGPRQVGKTTLARQIEREYGDRAIYLVAER